MALARHVNLLIRHYYSAKFFVNIQGIIYCGFLGVEQPLFAHAEHRESVVDVYIYGSALRVRCTAIACGNDRITTTRIVLINFVLFSSLLFLHPSPSQ